MSRGIERVLSFFGIDLAAENARLRERNEDLEERIDRAAINYIRLQSTNERLVDEISMWRAEVRKLESEKRQLAGDIEEATNRINDLLAELAATKSGGKQLPLVQAPDGAEMPIGEERIVSDFVREEVWQVVGVFFDERHWWHLALGERRIKVHIPDKTFLDQILKRQVFFAAGDALRVRLRTVTYQSGADLYAKYFVEEVLGVIAPDKQLQLEPHSPATVAEEGGGLTH